MNEGRIEKLSTEIDLRIYALMFDILEFEEWSPEEILPFLRAAYGKGYSDALADKGKLIKDHYLT